MGEFGHDATPGQRTHAVVLGAGMAGLLAARVLAGHFGQVTVVDRPDSRNTRASGRGSPSPGISMCCWVVASNAWSSYSPASKPTWSRPALQWWRDPKACG